MDHKQIVEMFLQLPVSCADGVFDLFSQLPGAIYEKGNHPLERFVYIPGTRKDRVVLVAHGDTVWDAFYGNPQSADLQYADGVFYCGNVDCGIGADDRAGCAMVWALKDSGHSLLIVDGEEKGKFGAKFLKKQYPKLYRQLNSHRFMMEMDWRGTGGCLYNQVDNTKAFKKYIADTLDFHDSEKKGGCDLQILCNAICGVNIGIGWDHCHSPKETLVLSHWESSYNALKAFLDKPQPKFRISAFSRFKKLLSRVKGKLGSILRKLVGK